MVHHHTDLTDPEIDPESFYLRPDDWATARVVERTYILVTRTMVGRLTARRGAQHRALPVARAAGGASRSTGGPSLGVHLPAAVLLGWWLFAVVGVPAWEYLLGLRRHGPVAHPAAVVRRALRRA